MSVPAEPVSQSGEQPSEQVEPVSQSEEHAHTHQPYPYCYGIECCPTSSVAVGLCLAILACSVHQFGLCVCVFT